MANASRVIRRVILRLVMILSLLEVSGAWAQARRLCAPHLACHWHRSTPIVPSEHRACTPGERENPRANWPIRPLATPVASAHNSLRQTPKGPGDRRQFTSENAAMRHSRIVLAALGLALGTLTLSAAAADAPVSGPDDPDFQVQGEYEGTVKSPDAEFKVGVQIIALGEGHFHAVAYPGGLPGDGWDGANKIEADGELKDGVVVFPGDQARGEIKDGVLRVLSQSDEVHAELKKAERKSPTLGAAPPDGAVVLFDGTAADQFEGGKISDDRLLVAGATSKRKTQDCQLHVEFLLPFMPQARGQARANSGCYLQGRYEVQMLDSFGLEGADNECGGIYSIKRPDTNMCYPPLAWQTYDIDFTAATYEGEKKVKNATITVRHNGVVIHKDVELPKSTTAAPVAEGPEPGPIYLQDHGNPVRYRNIWLVEKP
jgi:hypothetical protein